MERIPFVDLKAQYRSIRTQVDAAIREILENTAFVRSAAVQGFEERFAAYCGCRRCVGVGNGGMPFTDRDDLAEAMKSIRVHGKGTDKQDNAGVGLNARLDTLLASILLGYLQGDFPAAETANREVVNLPFGQYLMEPQARDVMDALIRGC